MGDRGQTAQSRQLTELSQEVTGTLWEAYRAGNPASCPNDSWPLALSVDATSGYRFVCTRCGTASPWFEAGPNGILVRSIPPPPMDPDYREET
jgi:hypothetical protein